jgi:quercetin dioxygenase-like cupin family protein
MLAEQREKEFLYRILKKSKREAEAMKEASGQVFSLTRQNQPLAGCTVSEAILGGAVVFSLGKDTNISAEAYDRSRLLYVLQGFLTVFVADGSSWSLQDGEALVMPPEVLVGLIADEDVIYLEITGKEKEAMKIDAGKVMKLADLVPYQEGKVVSRDIIDDPKLKLALMSFDAGTGLSEHAAPGEALIFALDGEGIIGYEGKEHRIHAGENFKFDKLGRHFVRADQRFKMALLLTL